MASSALEYTRDQSMNGSALRMRPAWKALERHYRDIKGVHLRQLFAEDLKRGERLAVEGAGIYFDYSKNRITDETLGLLLEVSLRNQSGAFSRTSRRSCA
jgi:hypothetical protein